MKRLFLLACLELAACGIQRPLVRPTEIPEYERKRQEKIDQRTRDMQEFDAQERERYMPQVMLHTQGVG